MARITRLENALAAAHGTRAMSRNASFRGGTGRASGTRADFAPPLTPPRKGAEIDPVAELRCKASDIGSTRRGVAPDYAGSGDPRTTAARNNPAQVALIVVPQAKPELLLGFVERLAAGAVTRCFFARSAILATIPPAEGRQLEFLIEPEIEPSVAALRAGLRRRKPVGTDYIGLAENLATA
jgi:hypothetical protein